MGPVKYRIGDRVEVLEKEWCMDPDNATEEELKLYPRVNHYFGEIVDFRIHDYYYEPEYEILVDNFDSPVQVMEQYIIGVIPKRLKWNKRDKPFSEFGELLQKALRKGKKEG